MNHKIVYLPFEYLIQPTVISFRIQPINPLTGFYIRTAMVAMVAKFRKPNFNMNAMNARTSFEYLIYFMQNQKANTPLEIAFTYKPRFAIVR